MSFRGIVIKSALLNLGLALAMLPFACVFLLWAEDAMFGLLLLLMGLASLVLWTLTFAISGLVFATAVLFCARGNVRGWAGAGWMSGQGGGVADAWLDDPT